MHIGSALISSIQNFWLLFALTDFLLIIFEERCVFYVNNAADMCLKSNAL